MIQRPFQRKNQQIDQIAWKIVLRVVVVSLILLVSSVRFYKPCHRIWPKNSKYVSFNHSFIHSIDSNSCLAAVSDIVGWCWLLEYQSINQQTRQWKSQRELGSPIPIPFTHVRFVYCTVTYIQNTERWSVLSDSEWSKDIKLSVRKMTHIGADPNSPAGGTVRTRLSSVVTGSCCACLLGERFSSLDHGQKRDWREPVPPYTR